jgi:hypothetical protein
MFLDIPTAAEMAGFSVRHFRRIMEEDGIPILQIGRKFFILGREFQAWESRKQQERAQVGLRKVSFPRVLETRRE